MRILLSFFLGVVFFGSAAQLSLAQSDSFNVRLLYGGDTEAPSTPTPFSVTPVAATQIDVTWGASTDNVQVVGYQVFRDAVQIATTTATTYFDTGLVASTTYSYYVTAFDAFGNISSSSIILAATTFAEPEPTSTTVAQSSIARLQLTSFAITPSTNGAKFAFSTNLATRFILRYGTSSVYDDGTIESPIYKRSHSTSLYPLEAGTTYVYELYGFDRFGREVLLSDGSFTTVELPDSTAPTNVANFSATAISTDTFLRWDNPTDDDFVYVRIVRNHLFYPQHESDGFLVYEGDANSFTDQAALREYDEQYYTIFTYDSSGNVSSGAVAYATSQLPETQPLEEGASLDDTAVDGSVSAGGSDDDINGQSTADMTVLYASSVQIIQGNVRQSLSDQQVILDSRKPYEVFIPIEAVPANLKTITARIVNPSNQRLATTYLLKINDEKTGYAALVPPPMVIGDSRVTVKMIDYTLGAVRRIEQSITFVSSDQSPAPGLDTFSRQDMLSWIVQGGLVLFLLSLLYIFFVVRRRREDKHDEYKIDY